MKIFKLNEGAQLPEFATEGSACFDVRACFELGTKFRAFNPHNREIELPVKENAAGEAVFQVPPQFRVLVPTGLIFNIPNNHVLKMYIRSSMAFKSGLFLANSVAIIDSDYVDETFILIYNSNDTPVTIKSGDRIAQGQLEKVGSYPLEEAKYRPSKKTDREGGVGSTGTE